MKSSFSSSFSSVDDEQTTLKLEFPWSGWSGWRIRIRIIQVEYETSYVYVAVGTHTDEGVCSAVHHSRIEPMY